MQSIMEILGRVVCKLGCHDWVHLRTDVDNNTGELWCEYSYTYYCRKCRRRGERWMNRAVKISKIMKPMDTADLWREVHGSESLADNYGSGMSALVWDEEFDELPVLS